MTDILKSLIQAPVANFCIVTGLLALLGVLAFKEFNGAKIENRRLIGCIAILLILLGISLYTLPYWFRRADANKPSGTYSLDWGKIGSLFFSKNGDFQLTLEQGFPNAKEKYGGVDIWPTGVSLSATVKQSLVAAKASGIPVGIVIRGTNSAGKYVIDEVYIGGPLH